MTRSVAPLLVAVLVPACFQSGAVVCDDGRICPSGTVCAAATNGCVDKVRGEVCAGKADGDGCVVDGIPDGVCNRGVCYPTGCGNGVVDDGEACDDGNTRSGDGCSADCLSTEVCGNGFKDPGEQCDCGTSDNMSPDCEEPNVLAAGLCRTDCVLLCGDGFVTEGEQCDPNAAVQPSCLELGKGYDRGLTTCSSACAPIDSSDTCKYMGWRELGLGGGVDMAEYAVGKGVRVFAQDAINFPPPAGCDPVLPESCGTHTGQTFTAVWTAGSDLAVVVGTVGTIRRWDGSVWSADVAPTSADLYDVWGRSANDIYAVGELGTIIHWNGTAWTTIASQTSAGLHGVSGNASAVYAVGDGGAIVADRGSGFAVEPSGTTADLRATWATGSLAVAVGAAGTIVENHGAGWTTGRTLATVDLASVWGSDVEGFFAVGKAGTVLFYDGAVWRPLSVGNQIDNGQDFLTVVGITGEEVILVGTSDLSTYEGATWSPTTLPAQASINALWGSAPDDVFAVGQGGSIFHHDGLSWTAQDSGTTANLNAVAGRAADDVFAVGDGGVILHYDGATWSELASPTAGDLHAVWPLAADTVVAGGDSSTGGFADGGVYQWVGLDSSMAIRVSVIPAHDLWPASDGTLWALNDSAVTLFGATRQTQNLSSSMQAISGGNVDGKSLVFTVGDGSYQLDGTSGIPLVSPGPFTNQGWRDIWVDSQLGAFAVGDGGTLVRYDGSVVEPLRSRSNDLQTVFVTGHLVFMAGLDGELDLLVFQR